MKQAGIFRRLLWLGGLLVFLSGCASSSTQGVHGVPSPPVQSVQASPTLTVQASPSQPIRQLKPDSPVPASCPATPVYTGGPFGENGPWLRAQPASTGIVAYLLLTRAWVHLARIVCPLSRAFLPRKACTPRRSGRSITPRLRVLFSSMGQTSRIPIRRTTTLATRCLAPAYRQAPICIPTPLTYRLPPWLLALAGHHRPCQCYDYHVVCWLK